MYYRKRFSVGDTVRITRGSFAGCIGTIASMARVKSRYLCQVDIGGVLVQATQVDLVLK